MMVPSGSLSFGLSYKQNSLIPAGPEKSGPVLLFAFVQVW